jgi:type IV secretory pathway TraG/TraD family ATPase VirD4
MRKDMAGDCTTKFSALVERPTTIYVIQPVQDMKANFLRLVLSAALRAIYRNGKVGGTIIIDEGYILGAHEELIRACAVLREWNWRICISFQSVEQAREHYPNTWGQLMSGSVLAFGPRDMATADFMSRRASDRPVASVSANDASKPGDIGTTVTIKPEIKRWIREGQLYSMPQGMACAWLPRDEKPHIVRVPVYVDLPKLEARADPNPLFKGKVRKPLPKGEDVWRHLRRAVMFACVAGALGAEYVRNQTVGVKPAAAVHHRHRHVRVAEN